MFLALRVELVKYSLGVGRVVGFIAGCRKNVVVMLNETPGIACFYEQVALHLLGHHRCCPLAIKHNSTNHVLGTESRLEEVDCCKSTMDSCSALMWNWQAQRLIGLWTLSLTTVRNALMTGRCPPLGYSMISGALVWSNHRCRYRRQKYGTFMENIAL